MLFHELFTEYLSVKEVELKPSTISTYLKFYNAQVKDYFDCIDLGDINESLVSKFILYLFNRSLEGKYIKSIMNFLYSVINYAKFHYRDYTELSYIQRKKIKVNRKKIVVFCDDEQAKMETYIYSHITPVNVGILLCLYTGIRLGELCALKVKDFDLKNKTVSISKTMQRVNDTSPNAKKKTKIIVDTPKSPNSTRIIPLPDFIIPILRKLFDGIDSNAYFLTLSEKKFIEPRLMEYKFQRFQTIIGIEYKNFHVTRHTFANTMLDLGVDIKTLSKWLGHSSVAVTMDEYIHPSVERLAKYADLLNKKFLSQLQENLVTTI